MSKKHILCAIAFALAAPLAHSQVLIDQAAAMAGGVTLGDAPGFPVSINLPGSYKLVGNLTSPAGQPNSLISVTVADVTLDLNGYTVQGTNTCNPTGLGYGNSCTTGTAPALINFSGPRGVLRNGYVDGSEGVGVRLYAGLSTSNHGALVEDLFISNSRGNGLDALIPGTTLHNVNASVNAGSGVVVSGDSSIDGVVASSNNGEGIRTAFRVAMNDIVAVRNVTDGAYVPGGNITRLVSVGNGGDGFEGEAAISFSRAIANAADGFNGPAMLTQSDASNNTGAGYRAPAAGGCYGNLHSTGNTGGNIAAGTGFVGALALCP